MMPETYVIRMDTPIGERNGMIHIEQIECGRVLGVLDVLNHPQSFVGVINIDGHCSLAGRITTLLKTFFYTAIGRITETSLQLSLQSEHGCFEMTGEPCLENWNIRE